MVICGNIAGSKTWRFNPLTPSHLEQGRRLLAEGAVAEADQALGQALELWRGPALDDFRYEEFARSETARLEELRVVALEARLEGAVALERHIDLVPELEGLAPEHPLRERLRGLLIRALYSSGRQADALAAYQDAKKRTLVDELGLDPSQVLQQLEKATLQQGPSLDFAGQAAPRPAPATPTPAPRPAAPLSVTVAVPT